MIFKYNIYSIIMFKNVLYFECPIIIIITQIIISNTNIIITYTMKS